VLHGGPPKRNAKAVIRVLESTLRAGRAMRLDAGKTRKPMVIYCPAVFEFYLAEISEFIF